MQMNPHRGCPVQLSVGCVRARFAKHIAILILVDACASAVGFYLFGYAFAWGDHANNADGSTSQNQFIGSQYFALSGLPHTQYYLWVFQWSVSFPPAAALRFKALTPALSCPSPCFVLRRYMPSMAAYFPLVWFGTPLLSCP